MIESIVFAAMLAAGPTEPQYRNPTQPSKDPAKLLDSGYRGWHYEPRWESFRKCVMARESGGNYKSDSRWGSGAYQFTQPTWNAAMTAAGMPEWVDVRPYLAPPSVQDEGFWITVNPKPKLKALHGAWHWDARWALTIGKTVKDCR